MKHLLRGFFAAALLALPAHAQTVSFLLSAFSVTNTAASVSILIGYSGGTSGSFASVDFTTSNGTAVAGTDYTAVSTNIDLTGNPATVNVSIPITANGTTDDLTVNLLLRNATGNVSLGTFSNATLTIRGEGTGGVPVSSVTHVFPIKLQALLTMDDTDQVVKVGFSNRGLTSDRLVLVVDPDSHTVSLGAVDSDNNVTFLATSTYAAILSSGQFGANLDIQNLNVVNDLINITGTGAVQIRGSFVVTDPTTGAAKLKQASLLGVFNDTVNGNSIDPDALLKGTITPAGKEYNIDDLNFPE